MKDIPDILDGVPVHTLDNMIDKKYLEMLEELAEIQHEAWMSWSKEISENEYITTDRQKRWEKLWIPYKDLSEKEKEQDSIWARKVLKILLKYEEEF